MRFLVLLLAVASATYTYSGAGKCLTPAGKDPAHSYYANQGNAGCKSLCDSKASCHGYSVSSFGNCLLWNQFVVGGGASWGGASCIVKDLSYQQKGNGKCITADDKDPKHSYHHSIGGTSCKSKCDADSSCYGFSVSRWGNCLNWLEYVKGGGSSWGGAGCAAKPTYMKDMGRGKCLTLAGKDPKHSYHSGVGAAGCKQLCEKDASCAGYSVSSFNNCLLWKQSVKGGGASWGGAHCIIKAPKFVVKAKAPTKAPTRAPTKTPTKAPTKPPTCAVVTSVGGWSACTNKCPCHEGGGDCDSNAQCKGTLICKSIKKGQPIAGASKDKCVKPCPKVTSVGGWSACTNACPCDIGGGDCDSDAQCKGTAKCVSTLRGQPIHGHAKDKCVAACTGAKSVGGWSACSKSKPCCAGGGDCDNDKECWGHLKCVSTRKGQPVPGWAKDKCAIVAEAEDLDVVEAEPAEVESEAEAEPADEADELDVAEPSELDVEGEAEPAEAEQVEFADEGEAELEGETDEPVENEE